MITCPECGLDQPKSVMCQSCGIVFSKLESVKQELEDKNIGKAELKQSSYADDVSGIKGSLLRFVDKTLNQLWFSISGGSSK